MKKIIKKLDKNLKVIDYVNCIIREYRKVCVNFKLLMIKF